MDPRKETLITPFKFLAKDQIELEYSLILAKNVFDQTPSSKDLMVRKTFRNSNMHATISLNISAVGVWMSQRRNSALIKQRNFK